MVYVIRKRHLSPREEKMIREVGQQPLDKDGWSNDTFTRKYGEKANPFIGTERDRRKRKKYF